MRPATGGGLGPKQGAIPSATAGCEPEFAKARGRRRQSQGVRGVSARMWLMEQADVTWGRRVAASVFQDELMMGDNPDMGEPQQDIKEPVPEATAKL